MLNRRNLILSGASLLPFLKWADCTVCGVDAVPMPKSNSLVIIMLAGGLSQLDTFDPKPDAPSQYRGPFHTIPTSVPGGHFTELVPKLAAFADKFMLIRSVSHGVGIHESAQKLMLTGSSVFSASTPAIGSAISCYAPGESDSPRFAAIPALPHCSGDLGPKYEPFNVLGDSGVLLRMAPDTNDGKEWDRLYARQEFLSLLDGSSSFSSVAAEAQRRFQVYEVALRSMSSKALRALTLLDTEPSSIRDLYGASPLAAHLIYARRLVEAGTRCVTVIDGDWDTHFDGFKTLSASVPAMDQAIAGFLSDLTQRDLIKTTSVAVITDFGRTPVINAMSGRDHWPKAGIAILAGAGVQGGATIGATDELGMEVKEQPIAPQDIAVSLLRLVGVDAKSSIVASSGRVLLPEGHIIPGLKD